MDVMTWMLELVDVVSKMDIEHKKNNKYNFNF